MTPHKPVRFAPLASALLLAAGFPGLTLADDGSTAKVPKPVPFSAEETLGNPERFCTRLDFFSGPTQYIGSATFVRRFTLLTCGHNLYDGKTGFSTKLHFAQAQSGHSKPYGKFPADSFAILSGFQEAAMTGNTDNAYFSRDMARITTTQPPHDGVFINWGVDLAALTNSESHFRQMGYPGGIGEGNVMYGLHPSAAYTANAEEGLYTNTTYYTFGGQSGGPVYAYPKGGVKKVVAVNVSGDDNSSQVRAVTEEARKLVINGEYDQGLITGGIIKGEASVKAGQSYTYHTKITYKDGTHEGARSDEMSLVVAEPNAAAVKVEPVKDEGHFRLTFDASLSGKQVTLRLERDTIPSAGQTPLQTLEVTVE